MMAETAASKSSPSFAWLIAACLVAVVGITRAIPYEQRFFNMTAVGALAIYTAARIGLWQALAFTFGALLFSDAILFSLHHYDRQYLPNAAVYGAFPQYALLAWLFLRNSENPLRIGVVTVSGGLFFFLISNFAVWLGVTHQYEHTWAGLMECYEAALPFYRGIPIGDLTFTAAAFGAHAVLCRVCVPKDSALESVSERS
jgi:hypothetical protein